MGRKGVNKIKQEMSDLIERAVKVRKKNVSRVFLVLMVPFSTILQQNQNLKPERSVECNNADLSHCTALSAYHGLHNYIFS